MANVALIAFRDEAGKVPFFEWAESLPEKAQDKLWLRLERLQDRGNDLRRPEADYLRDGIYELRFKHLRVNYRVLYFFQGRSAVVVSHGLVKEKFVPPKEIDLAVARRNLFLSDPKKYAAKGDLL